MDFDVIAFSFDKIISLSLSLWSFFSSLSPQFFLLQVLYKHKIIVFGGFYDTLREVRWLIENLLFFFWVNYTSI